MPVLPRPTGLAQPGRLGCPPPPPPSAGQAMRARLDPNTTVPPPHLHHLFLSPHPDGDQKKTHPRAALLSAVLKPPHKAGRTREMVSSHLAASSAHPPSPVAPKARDNPRSRWQPRRRGMLRDAGPRARCSRPAQPRSPPQRWGGFPSPKAEAGPDAELGRHL